MSLYTNACMSALFTVLKLGLSRIFFWCFNKMSDSHKFPAMLVETTAESIVYNNQVALIIIHNSLLYNKYIIIKKALIINLTYNWFNSVSLRSIQLVYMNKIQQKMFVVYKNIVHSRNQTQRASNSESQKWLAAHQYKKEYVTYIFCRHVRSLALYSVKP